MRPRRNSAPSTDERDPYAEVARLYAFFRREFFNFDTHLSSVERDFIEACMERNPEEWGVVYNDGFSYSLFSFSHRVRGRSVNSSRVFFAHHRDPSMRGLSEAVSREWGFEPGELPLFDQTVGFGWDVMAGIRKTYILLDDLSKVADAEMADLYAQVRGYDLYTQGLASVSIVHGKIVEKKIYAALREPVPELVEHLPFADSVIHTNLMVTSERGVVPQVDVGGQLDPAHFNPIAAAIIERYATLDLGVDTVAYQGPDDYVLYIPA